LAHPAKIGAGSGIPIHQYILLSRRKVRDTMANYETVYKGMSSTQIAEKVLEDLGLPAYREITLRATAFIYDSGIVGYSYNGGDKFVSDQFHTFVKNTKNTELGSFVGKLRDAEQEAKKLSGSKTAQENKDLKDKNEALEKRLAALEKLMSSKK
jgi:hypothetical protein